MAFTYFTGSSVHIYPSANADDGGDLSTEKNLSQISNNLSCQNYVIDKRLTEDETTVGFHNSFEVDGYNSNSLVFNLYAGKCVIAGRNIEIKPVSADYFTLDLGQMISTQGQDVGNTPHLMLVLLVDGTGNVSSDLVVNGVRTCRGVGVVLGDPSTIGNTEYFIDLGEFTLVLNGNNVPVGIADFTPNNLIYTYIDQKSIKVDGKSLEEVLGEIKDENVKQTKVSGTGSLGAYSVLFTTANPVSGQVDPVVYLDKFYYIAGTGIYLENTPLYLTSGVPLHLENARYYNTEILFDGYGWSQSNRLLYPCTTAGGTSNKELTFPAGTTRISGQIIKVKFTNANTATSPTINSIPIYLQDGTVCPSSAINSTTTIYEFIYYDDGNGTTSSNPKWVLLNPSAVTHTAVYGSGAINVTWSQEGTIVNVEFSTSPAGSPSGPHDYVSGDKLPKSYSVGNQYHKAYDITTAINPNEVLAGIKSDSTSHEIQIVFDGTQAGVGSSYRSVFTYIAQ